MRYLRVTRTGVLLLMGLVVGCGYAPREAGGGDSGGSAAWEQFVADFIEAHFAAHPDAAIKAGRHESDGQLPDWSPEALEREAERLRAAKRQALAFDEATLSDAQRFERHYLLSRVDHDLFWLVDAGWPRKNPSFYADPINPSDYLTRDYAPLADRMRAFTTFLGNLPRAVQQMRSNLETPLPRPYVELAIGMFGGMVRYFEEDAPAIFAEVEDEELWGEMRAAEAPAIASLQELVDWLETQRQEATEDFALGPELFSAMLRDTEGVDVPLARLKEVAEADLERNLAALEGACNQIANGAPIGECVARVQAAKPPGGAVQGARSQLAGLKQFLLDQALVTIPSNEEALVEEAPPHRRWNFAYIEIPGPYERELPSVYYISPPDPSWSEEEQNAYVSGEAYLLFTSVHEVWPGHFLNFLHSQRSPSEFGQLFVGYAFAEGWAHYTEEMMWEAGLGNGNPEMHAGQLLNALRRNVRFLSAIGLQTEGMTVEESYRMFREKAYEDPGNARQQAARGTFDPAYLNYTMGKLMIRKLREDWTASRGGRAAWRDFHDQFLSYGAPPIPLVREAMLGRADGELF